MAVISLSCPVCHFSKKMEVRTLPPSGTQVTCPNCKSVFPLIAQAAVSPAADAARQDGPAQPDYLPPPSQPPRTLSFTFTGNAKEYFGIWIVNTLLRLVTLGLYSPWAKVRKRRYFCGNTLLDGAPFDYLADPWAILKGWLIAGVFFGLYSYSSRINPALGLGFMLVFLGAFPWVVVRARAFTLKNSTHRNIRFAFNPDYREAYRVFLWWQLLIPFTGGLIAPYVIYRQKKFLMENSSYGTTSFRFHAKPEHYFKAFVPVLAMIPLAAGALVWLVLSHKGEKVATLLPALAFPIIYLFAALYVTVTVTNVTWSSTSLGNNRFKCSLRVRDLAWIYFSNAVAVICSLGLLAPWAVVRVLRYRLEKITLTGLGGLDSITAAATGQIGATAEELGDILGFDLGL